ncbi:helix-turn-helix transcriptional regulator [Pedobacter psychrodurus]|uniref:helix-turn-helix domain-containing protein n=1 Tax=Pedobacter psychrodurus TaxID=2530456 RepID=UPI002931BDE3|nr:helix-turn-helix transcriptional regulator [Pedobacter psychrodurus]
METSEKTKNIHLGRKISRIRELRGMKQEALAAALGISQQAISKLEQSEDIEDTTLEKVATALGVSAEAIKGFSEESIFNYFNTFNDTSSGDFRQHCTFNPLDKVVELYERLLASEREKVELFKNK